MKLIRAEIRVMDLNLFALDRFLLSFGSLDPVGLSKRSGSGSGSASKYLLFIGIRK
jgi:hypothetical protein